MNYMEQVAEMLGVELGEEFRLENQVDSTVLVYKFTRTGLQARSEFDFNWCDCNGLESILTGEFDIIKMPWKPQDGRRNF